MNKLPFHDWLFPKQLIFTSSSMTLISTGVCRTKVILGKKIINISQDTTSMLAFSIV